MGPDDRWIVVKKPGQPKALCLKIYVQRQGAAQVSGSNQNCAEGLIQTKNSGNLLKKALHPVAIPLLSKASEAVQVLPYLRGRQSHYVCQLPRRYMVSPLPHQLAQKTIVTGEAADYGNGHILIFCQFDDTSLHFIMVSVMKLFYITFAKKSSNRRLCP